MTFMVRLSVSVCLPQAKKFFLRKNYKDSEVGPVTLHRVKLVLEKLIQYKMVKCDQAEADKMSYSITSFGCEWMEDWFYVHLKDGKYNFQPKYNDTIIVGEKRSNYERRKKEEKMLSSPSSGFDWAKWGAIAGIIAIPVALFTWWFS